jgi:hypothetical protein
MILESLLGEETNPLMSSELLAALLGAVAGSIFGAIFSGWQMHKEWRRSRTQHLLVTYQNFLARELDWAIALANWSDADSQTRDQRGTEATSQLARIAEAICSVRGEDPLSVKRKQIAEDLFELNMDFSKLIRMNSSDRSVEKGAWEANRLLKRTKLNEQLKHLGAALPPISEMP